MATAKKKVDVPKKERQKAEPIDVDSIIRVHSGENIKERRKGTAIAKICDEYKDGMTVAKWLAKVKDLNGGLGNLRKDIKFGRVTLDPPVKKK